MEARTLEPNTLAPWGEIVPGAGPMTIDDLFAYPDDDGWRYELVEGVLIRVAGSRPRAVRVTTRLFLLLGNFVEEHGLGQVTPPDAVYDFAPTGQPNTGLLPDIAFYVAAREALVQDDKAYPFAPDLAIEIASPLQRPRAMGAKARRYLRGGTRLVWIIYPHVQQADIWHPGDRAPSITLGIEDTLDGEDVVPGFRAPLGALFR